MQQTASAPTRRQLGTRSRARRSARRWWWWGAAIVLIALLAAATWVGVRALLAKDELDSARAEITDLTSQIGSTDHASTEATYASIEQHTAQARSLTTDPIWRASEHVPFLGVNLTAVRQIAEVVDDTVSQVAGPLIGVSTSLDPAALAPAGGAFNVSLVTAAVEPVNKANEALQSISQRARDIPASGTVGPVASARSEIVGMLDKYAPTLATVNTVLPVLPKMMGAERPQTYVIMFQNPAEPRALGGAALSFAEVTVDHGRISVGNPKPAATGDFLHFPHPVIPVPDGADAVYPDGEFGRYIGEASLRPSITTAGELIQANWKLTFGKDIDGVISLDPVALSYLLRATGPVATPAGDTLDSKNLVDMLLNGVYLRYTAESNGAANHMQDAYYASVVTAVFDRFETGPIDGAALVAAAEQGWQERRLLFWSADENVRTALNTVGSKGELPVTDDATVRAGLYVQDSVGSKLGFYLRQSVVLSHGACAVSDDEVYRVQATFTNTIDGATAASLPAQIIGEWKREGLYPGLNRMTLRLYAPPGATELSATVDGAPVALDPMHDTDYPVAKMRVSVAPGASAVVTYTFRLSGDARRAFEAEVTPLVTPTEIQTAPLECAPTS